MTIPEPSGEQKARDERAFAQATADTERRQQQAAAFQNTRTPTADVRAGEKRL